MSPRLQAKVIDNAVGLDNLAEMHRLEDLKRFYSLLSALERRNHSVCVLSDCSGRMAWTWPKRGVYFFCESGETRTDTGNGLRFVRVGTHALKPGAKSTLWQRLSRHKGITKTGGGNHRGSIFRLLVGTALIKKNGYVFNSWGENNTADTATTKLEEPLEIEVSKIIGNMPFLWLAVEDDAGTTSLRGYIEKNSIALLSNLDKTTIDAPSANWLGFHCNSEKVRRSGLWNQDHTDKNYDAAFLDELERLIQQMQAAV